MCRVEEKQFGGGGVGGRRGVQSSLCCLLIKSTRMVGSFVPTPTCSKNQRKENIARSFNFPNFAWGPWWWSLQKKFNYVTIQFVITCNYLSFATMFYIFTTSKCLFNFCGYGATTKLYVLPYWLTSLNFHPKIGSYVHFIINLVVISLLFVVCLYILCTHVFWTTLIGYLTCNQSTWNIYSNLFTIFKYI
jgi:hypothetical protein